MNPRQAGLRLLPNASYLFYAPTELVERFLSTI